MDRLNKKLVTTIGHLYEIAHVVDQLAWIEAYELIAQLFDADGLGAITIYDRSKDRMISLEGRLDHSMVPEYLDVLQYSSPLRPKFSQLRVGERLNRADILSDDEFLAHSSYNLFYKRASIFQLEYRVFLEEGPIHAGIVLTRTEKRSNFSATQLKAMDLLMPHLAQAFRFRFRMAHVHKQNDMVTSLIDRVPTGVIVVNRKRTLKYANAAAREIMASGDGLSLTAENLLTTGDARVERRLHELIIDALESDGGPAREFRLAIDRQSGKRRYELTLVRMEASNGSPFAEEPAVSIFVSDSSYEPDHGGAMLTTMFDLTPAESRVATMLAGGRALNQIAEELGISKHTARSHLKRTLSKTNTHSQGELIRLLLTGPAGLRPA